MREGALLGVLIGALLVQAVALRIAHRDRETLWRDARGGSAAARIDALHILSHRDQPEGIDAALVAELLAAPEPTVREFALTRRFRRFGARSAQKRHLDEAVLGDDERVRAWVTRFA